MTDQEVFDRLAEIVRSGNKNAMMMMYDCEWNCRGDRDGSGCGLIDLAKMYGLAYTPPKGE